MPAGGANDAAEVHAGDRARGALALAGCVQADNQRRAAVAFLEGVQFRWIDFHRLGRVCLEIVLAGRQNLDRSLAEGALETLRLFNVQAQSQASIPGSL